MHDWHQSNVEPDLVQKCHVAAAVVVVVVSNLPQV